MNIINHLGVGTVAATKQTGSNEIMVYLPRFAPQAEGRTVATATEVEKTSQNAYGEETKSKVLTTNAFPAEWRAMGDSNRVTAPDVREGSQVSIYQVSGQAKYYWTTYGVNAETFRLETVVMGYSANPSINDDTPFNIENFYTLTVSTHEGFAAFRTTQQNNEKTTFEIKVDSMNGKIMASGGQKNFFMLDDMAHQLVYKNVDNSIFDVSKKKVTVYTEDSITLAAKETVSFKTTNFNLECKKIGIKADEADISIGITRWTGDIIQDGDYTQDGDYNQKGDTTRVGSTHSTGTAIALEGVFTALNSLDLHTHGGVRSGDSSTSQPLPGTGAG